MRRLHGIRHAGIEFHGRRLLNRALETVPEENALHSAPWRWDRIFRMLHGGAASDLLCRFETV